MVFCGECEHYNPRTQLVNKGEVNVSGRPVWYREPLSHCRKNHNKGKINYECKFYTPNAGKKQRDEKFEMTMAELRNV